MGSWGYSKKKEQAYPKTPAKSKLVNAVGNVHPSTGHVKLAKPATKSKPHIYRIFSYKNSEHGWEDSYDEIGRVKANSLDDAITFIKKQFIKQEYQDKMDVDESMGDVAVISSTYPVNEYGHELKYTPDEDDENVDWITEGWEVREDDKAEEKFETIYGGNDFWDVTEGVENPKTKGMTSEEAIKFHGNAPQALFFGLNRINQKVSEDNIRERYRKLIDAVNNQPIPEKSKKVLISELEAKMKDEIRGIGRAEVGELSESGFEKPSKDYGEGYGVR